MQEVFPKSCIDCLNIEKRKFQYIKLYGSRLFFVFAPVYAPFARLQQQKQGSHRKAEAFVFVSKRKTRSMSP